jgi:Fic family protein
MSAPTARAALNHMTALGILEEMSGKKRDKTSKYS